MAKKRPNKTKSKSARGKSAAAKKGKKRYRIALEGPRKMSLDPQQILLEAGEGDRWQAFMKNAKGKWEKSAF